ncbi:hypothetical protein [Kiloniella laminariae]|uniref:hypothetical protein n=1 Tax=Kiloniella laminariae TaxID=454162 RepID=UPI000360629C|nr:hypothetical protein [Kiloniella laminariae]
MTDATQETETSGKTILYIFLWCLFLEGLISFLFPSYTGPLHLLLARTVGSALTLFVVGWIIAFVYKKIRGNQRYYLIWTTSSTLFALLGFVGAMNHQ